MSGHRPPPSGRVGPVERSARTPRLGLLKNDGTTANLLLKGLARPSRILPYLQRRLRDRRLRRAAVDHMGYYALVVDDNAARDPDRAVGSQSRDEWLSIGQMQFDYLLAHGLRPEHRLLDIGCGNLRAGHLLIDYLRTGNYVGTDISPYILFSAQEQLAGFGLRDKLPYLFLVQDMRFEAFPDAHFDVIHAHSVFSHTPLELIEECLAHVGRIMRPDAFFDFTFKEGMQRHFLGEDFWYPAETLIVLAESCGFSATKMDDWRYSQEKLRLRRLL